MSEYSKSLGDSVKRARGKMKLTQHEVAEKAEVDVRTVLNIENYKGNPKFEVLCSIIRTLNLDTQEIFYPEMSRESAPLTYLQQIIGGCSNEEAEMLYRSSHRFWLHSEIKKLKKSNKQKEPASPFRR